MATVDGLTKARMLAIEAASVVSGIVNGAGHLILAKHDLSTIDAGSVIGPQGIQGPPGPTSIAICTSGTRPVGGARFEGLMIYETDTDRMYTWDGANWIPRGVVVCTSGTRPAGGSLFEGLMIYETDTDSLLIWNAVRWDKPWNIPWGLVGAGIPASVAGVSVVAPGTDLGGNVTATFVANRRIRVEAQIDMQGTVVGDMMSLNLVKDGAQVSRWSSPVIKANSDQTAKVSYLDTPTAGVHTYKLAISRNSGTGQIASTSGGIISPHFLVEDLGPNGVPA